MKSLKSSGQSHCMGTLTCLDVNNGNFLKRLKVDKVSAGQRGEEGMAAFDAGKLGVDPNLLAKQHLHLVKSCTRDVALKCTGARHF